jgi:hypothetical protein
MPYLLDANVFIQAKNLHYGFDFCLAFWDWLLENNARGLVSSIEKVLDELIAVNDDLATWTQARGTAFFLPPDAAVLPDFGKVTAWLYTQPCFSTLPKQFPAVPSAPLPVASPSGNGGAAVGMVPIVVGKVTPVRYDSATESGQEENGAHVCARS